MDVLFRISLAILRMNEADLLKCTSISGIYMALESIPTRMWDADKLLKVRNAYGHIPETPLVCVYTLPRLKLNFDLP
jgi:hypothetical protein